MATTRIEFPLTKDQAEQLAIIYQVHHDDTCAFCNLALPAERTPFITPMADKGRFYFVALMACMACALRINKAVELCRSIVIPRA